jgi:single-strand DNA-binding protein
MEFINRIELVGVVGTIRKQTYCGRVVANFSVVTEYSYKDKTGGAVVETTWHNVVVWENGSMPLDLIEKGTQVCVQGRLRCRRHFSESGEPRTTYEVIAASVNIVP